MTKQVKTHLTNAAFVSALIVGLHTVIIQMNTANAQGLYYRVDSPVSVNLNVLDTLGEEPTLPGLLRPRISNTRPVLTNDLPGSTMIPISPRLNNQGANIPAGEMPVSGLTNNVARQVTPRPVASTTPTPAEPLVEPATPVVLAVEPTPVTPPAMPESSLASTTENATISTNTAAEVSVGAEESVEVAPATTAEVAEPPVAQTPEEEPVQVSVTPAPAPVPVAPAPQEATQTPTKQTAALTQPDNQDVIQKNDGVMTVIFGVEETELPEAAQAELDDIARQMKENEDLQLFLEGYARIPDASPNQSRRMSLFRAISLRNYLVKQDIPSRRIKVRAFGDKADGGNSDRVDVFFE